MRTLFNRYTASAAALVAGGVVESPAVQIIAIVYIAYCLGVDVEKHRS